MLFTDVSVNSKTKVGFGAYLVILESDLLVFESSNIIPSKIQLKKFIDTSSTKLEVQTLLWALDELYQKHVPPQTHDLEVYTDSNCIVSLEHRQERLESNNYKSLGKNRELNNASLYKCFYEWRVKLNFSLIKIKGHSKKTQKDKIDNIFSFVDRAARNALRNFYDQ
jgi:ribonuclease HI